ncbi:MAG: HEAT repeat domain-containing protein [Armatimonadota bacterium]
MRSVCAALLLVAVTTGLAPAQDGAEGVSVHGVPLVTLVAHLRGDDAVLRLAALLVLERAGPEAAAAVPALTELLDADEAHIRGRAIGALSGIGAAAGSAAAKLRHLADNDLDPMVRESARTALAEVGEPATQPLPLTLTPIGGGFEIEIVPEGAQETVPEVTQIPEPALPVADPGVTAYLQPLRDHQARLTAIEARVKALEITRPQDNDQARRWAQELESAGNELITEGHAFRQTLRAFVTSRTRRGLTEELDLIEQCMRLTDGAGGAIQTRTNFDVRAYGARLNLQQEAAAARNELIGLLAREVDERIEAEGFLVLLATEGISAVKNEAVSRLRTEAEAELDRITQRELGLSFHDASSFRSAVRARSRELVQRQVSRLLFRITSNQIVVELLGAPIVAWIEGDLWPRLKEAFRNKGDLPFRTQRSAASLESARMRLWALPPDATLDQVRAALRNADGALSATRYLVGDLNRANRIDLYTELESAAAELRRAMSITQQRFLLHKLEELEKIAPQEDVYRALLALIEAMVREIEVPAAVATGDDGGAPAEGTPRQEVERIDFPPRYLVHIILTHTPNGPVEKDVWILHPGTPDENGTLLTADGYGGNFINKADRYSGPYTSNYQLAPVLVQLGLPGIWLGQRYIRADPEIWGGG